MRSSHADASRARSRAVAQKYMVVMAGRQRTGAADVGVSIPHGSRFVAECDRLT